MSTQDRERPPREGNFTSPPMRALGSFLACLFWLQILIGAAHAGQPILALPVFCTFLAFDAFSLYLAALETELGST